MKFWDASAIVPLLVAESMTRPVQALARGDPEMLVWWGSEVECGSALTRLEGGGALDGTGTTIAYNRLRQLSDGWHEIEPTEIVRKTALRFLRIHPLRAADALQLAAAERRPASLGVMTLDERLADAASEEGFVLVDVALS
jgi:uncharacterized protein